MQCPACGVETVGEAVYCHKCGRRLAFGGDDVSQDSAAEASAIPAGAFQQVAAARWENKNPPEEDIWRGGYSPKAMLGGWILSGGISVVLLLTGILCGMRGGMAWLFLVLAMLLPWLYFLVVLGYRRISVHYSLSTQRFIHERGFFRRVNDRIELLDIDDVTFEQRLWERMVGVGTLRLVSHDRTSPELVLHGIDDIKRVAGLFDDARLAERRRRGLHVEQI